MLCSYMFIEAALLAYRHNYSLMPCNDSLETNPPIANLLWLFCISKVWNFWDTIFIVLNKKWRQLSFLHVYHHTTIFLFYWLNCHINYDGDIYLTIVLNGFIHAAMCTYYFICMHTKVPETGKNLNIWWKSSLTMMQLIQFTCMMSQATYLMVVRRLVWELFLHTLFIFWVCLFCLLSFSLRVILNLRARKRRLKYILNYFYTINFFCLVATYLISNSYHCFTLILYAHCTMTFCSLKGSICT